MEMTNVQFATAIYGFQSMKDDRTAVKNILNEIALRVAMTEEVYERSTDNKDNITAGSIMNEDEKNGTISAPSHRIVTDDHTPIITGQEMAMACHGLRLMSADNEATLSVIHQITMRINAAIKAKTANGF
jgi:hypothetical protein